MLVHVSNPHALMPRNLINLLNSLHVCMLWNHLICNGQLWVNHFFAELWMPRHAQLNDIILGTFGLIVV